MITIYKSFHDQIYQMQEVLFVEQKGFRFLGQVSGILFLMNLRRIVICQSVKK